MVRKKLAVIVAALSAMQAGVVGALGVGDFKLNSALNQPLDAEIRLIDMGDLDQSQVKVVLASPESFKLAGVDRDYFLTNLKFNVELNENGGGLIKVTTREPVIEPYLNFLIETRWPTGRLLREYTVLLDLPVFSESQVGNVATAKSIAEAVEEPRQQPQEQSRPALIPAAPAPATVAKAPARVKPAAPKRQSVPDGEIKPGNNYRVKVNETLWEIAMKARPTQDISVQQTMVAIQEINPKAFAQGNINRLKAGHVLRLPTGDEAGQIANRNAVKEVANQNRKWRSGDTETFTPSEDVQLDARTQESPVVEDYDSSARLSISSNGSSSSNEGADGDAIDEDISSASNALQEELDATAENLDKVELENNELSARLQNAEETLSTVQRLLELKEEELAALQVELQKRQTEAAQQTDVASEASAEKPKPAAKVKSAEKSLADELLDNSLYIGGAAFLLIVIALIVIMRRRKEEEEDVVFVPEALEQEPEVTPEDIAEEPVEEPVEEAVSEVDETDNLIAELEEEIAADNTEELAATDAAADTSVQQQTGDALAEADIYIAYGRYQQAVDLLVSAIALEPVRSDLQVKLLEVYTETRDKSAFQEQYAQLQTLGDEDAVIEVKEILSTVDGVADWLDTAEDTSIDSALVEETETTDEFSQELDIELGDDDSDELTLDEDLDLDFDLDLDDDSTTLSDEGDLDDLDEPSLDDLGAELDELGATADSLPDESADQSSDAQAAAVPDDDIELDLDELNDSLQEDTALDDLALDDLALDDLELDVDDEADLGLAQTPDLADAASDDDDEDSVVNLGGEVDESFTQDVESDDDLDFLGEGDEVATKLDLARAYIDMGDTEGASDILDEVMQEGTDEQKQEATALMERID